MKNFIKLGILLFAIFTACMAVHASERKLEPLPGPLFEKIRLTENDLPESFFLDTRWISSTPVVHGNLTEKELRRIEPAELSPRVPTVQEMWTGPGRRGVVIKYAIFPSLQSAKNSLYIWGGAVNPIVKDVSNMRPSGKEAAHFVKGRVEIYLYVLIDANGKINNELLRKLARTIESRIIKAGLDK
ncbi:MAG: hypothetical protein J7M18_04405 [Candidatus Eremiobacteraeota bacterium]|nr:hypothetical protein [Candidatus Eremiobacteraeota bacterium]